jgi:mono/diheme cytochrome c family protein
MPRMRILFMVMACALLLAALAPASKLLTSRRDHSTDLEITGLVDGVPPGESRFISYASLSSLPKVTFVLKHDDNFAELPVESAMVSGVDLEVLAKTVGARPDAELISAVCADGYTAPFPTEAIHAHHPVLVLTMDGLPLDVWAEKNQKPDLGPYLITYDNFVPAFHVLSHSDFAQSPAQLVRLDFTTSKQQAEAFAPIADASHSITPQVQDGYLISQQNCFRCHNSGPYGGTKSGKSWQKLAKLAKKDPAEFQAWVRNPKSVDPDSKMPPNPKYDQATLDALTAYFQDFANRGN